MTIKEYKPEYTYLGIAMAGVYAKAVNPYSEDSSISVTIYDNRLEPYFGDLVEGGVVVDKRPCVKHDEFYHMVVGGPMLRESLPNQTINSFVNNQREHCTDARTCRGFDYVSLDLYLKLWKELGAKVGYRRGNVIEWDNGEKTEIPPATRRFTTF